MLVWTIVSAQMNTLDSKLMNLQRFQASNSKFNNYVLLDEEVCKKYVICVVQVPYMCSLKQIK